MLKKKHTAEEKYQAIAECGKSSIHAVAKKYEIGTTTLREWIAKHESMGVDGLQEAIGRNRRPEAEKQEAVLAYVKSNRSLEDVCKRFKIRSKTQLREWIKQYNSHEKLETSANGGGIFMTKGRTVTFEEKVEIVQFCMANGKDYSGARANDYTGTLPLKKRLRLYSSAWRTEKITVGQGQMIIREPFLYNAY